MKNEQARNYAMKYWVPIIVSILVILIAVPFLFNVAGDAQVHLAFAENFVRDIPFRYTAGGEIALASTSPFWTIMLAFFYWIAGPLAPLLLGSQASQGHVRHGTPARLCE